MFANLAPQAVRISASFDRAVELAAAAGFEGIDLPLGEEAVSADPEAATAKIRAAGLRWGGFGLPVDFRRDDAAYDAGLQSLRGSVGVARRAGCTRCYTWLMPGHNELDYRANFERHARRLRPVAQLLADNGARLGIEFVGTRTVRAPLRHEFVHTIDQALELADAIGSGTGILLDSFHWYTSGATVEDITTKLRGRIVYVHVNDARAGRSREEQIDHERALPGETGVIDLAGFTAALREVDYDGPVTAEPFMPELGDLPPEVTAARVAASVRNTIGR